MTSNSNEIYNQAQEYYGKTLEGTSSLKTNCCTCSEKPPKYISDVISLIHPDVENHYYGCGLVIPPLLSNLTCLDLGSGAGRDCYILSKLVGPNGKVYGVDMTQEQLDIAEKYKDYHAKKYGYEKSNVQFIKGFIEDLKDIPSESIDLIVSNCVVNLSPNKEAVLKEAYRVLKYGGEMYFSDVYSDRRIPEKLLNDPVLHGECLSGALYWNDFIHLAIKCGFTLPLLVKGRKLTIGNKEIEDKIGFANFYSATYRLFKIKDLEEDCEDYGQFVTYKGTIENEQDLFNLNCFVSFNKGEKCKVCGNTFRILKGSRFAEHFEFEGDFSTHYGIAGHTKYIPFNSAYQCCGSCCEGNTEKKKCCSDN